MSIVSVPRTIVPPDALLPRNTHGDDVRMSDGAATAAAAASSTHSELLAPRPGSLVRTAPLRESTALLATRNEAVDVVRFFAALGIVFVHACQSAAIDPWRNMFRFAVPFYLFASLYFQSLSLRRNPDRTLASYIAGRVRRLYLPFLAWSLIYLIAHDIKRLIFGDSLMPLRLDMLYTGTEYHLWFLPFLLGISIIMAVIYRTLLARDARLRWVLIPLAIIVGIVFTTMPMPGASIDAFTDFSNVYLHWWRSSSAACWAMAFAWLTTLGPVVYSVGPILGVGGIALMLTCSLKQVVDGIQIIPRSLTGLGCMLAALLPWRGPVVSRLARYGRYGYGVYLCHVLIVEPCHIVIAKLRLQPTVWTDLATFVLAFSGALLLVNLFARSPKLRWLNG